MVSGARTWRRGLTAPRSGIAILALLLTGCVAGTRGGPVYASNANAAGIRYFLPAMYLVVQQSPEGTLSTSFEVLADSSQTYYVEPFIVLATQKADITLNLDGTLQSFKLEQDGTPVSAAVVGAVKDISLKKLELEQAAAEAKPAGGRAEGDARTIRRSRIWIFQISGKTANPVASVNSLVPPKPASSGATTPTGAIEGKFTITIDGEGKRTH